MKKKDPEGYYAVSSSITVLIVLVIHYILLSKINLHPTLHVAIGLFLFYIFVVLTSGILKKFW